VIQAWEKTTETGDRAEIKKLPQDAQPERRAYR